MRTKPTAHAPARPALVAGLMILAVFLAACSSAVGAPPPTDQPAAPSPSVAPPTLFPPPSLVPAPPTPDPVDPTPAPVPTEPPASPRPTEPADPTSPTPRPVPDFTDAERELIGTIRHDARESCTPRRTELPDGAIAGVECRPSSGPAARVGVYQFPTNRKAAQAYFDRLLSNHVEPNSGNCFNGHPGDDPWIPGDGEPELADDEAYGIVVDGIPYVADRQGCFLDEGATANARVTCGDGRYIGILGRSDDIAPLFRWTLEYETGVPMPTPTAPGICVGEPD